MINNIVIIKITKINFDYIIIDNTHYILKCKKRTYFPEHYTLDIIKKMFLSEFEKKKLSFIIF